MPYGAIQEMKILYATTIGSSTWSFLRGQLAYFQSRGADVHAVSSPDRLLEAAGVREGVTTHSVEMEREISPVADIVAFIKWVELLREERPDVVNVGTPKAALLGLVSAWLIRVPIRVYTVRGLRYQTTNGARRALLKGIESLCCALSTHIIAVGHGVATEMKSDGVTKAPVIVIGDGSSNGVRADALAASADRLDRTSCRARWSIAPDAFVVGFVGRVSPDKGGDCLSEALDILAGILPSLNLVLLVVGDGEDEASMVSMTANPNRTRHTGWIDDPVPAFKAMDLLCLPTRREGFPNVVLEAGAIGIPTVTTSATGARESVVEGQTGLIVPVDDPQALANAIADLANAPDRRAEMGRMARQRVFSKFRPERIWEALEIIYQGGTSDDATEY